MANKVSDTKVVSNPTPVLPERIHMKQFLAMHPELNEMQSAGFKALCGTKEWMRENEWVDKLNLYNNK